jgi:aryl-alcohol dehydrogenase-like predicted oxidoreductase
MQKRNLGRSGLLVSLVGLGCNNFGAFIDLEASRKVVDKAIDLGITLFDTADFYGKRGGSETMLGQILGDRRKDIVLATKFGLPMDEAETLKGGSRRYIFSAIEASLRRLKTDWIDLYQLHQVDPLTPMEETLRALDDLIHQGKIRYIGISNHPAWKVADADWISRHLRLNAFVSCQDEYSLLVRDPERELIPMMTAHGLGLLPYFPLASGMLSGKYKRDHLPEGTRLATAPYAKRFTTEANFQAVERLREFCTKRGHALLELAFSWLVANPINSSVIAGATKPEQLEQNVKAVNWALTPEDLAEIDALTNKAAAK